MSKQNIIDDINEKIIGASEANSISPSVLGDILLDTMDIIPSAGTGGGTFDEVLEAGNTTDKSFYHRLTNEFVDIKSGVIIPESIGGSENSPFIGIEMTGVDSGDNYLSSMGFYAGEGVAIRRQSYTKPDKDGAVELISDYFYFPRLNPDGTQIDGSPLVVATQIMNTHYTTEELSLGELLDTYTEAIDGFKVYCPNITSNPDGKKRVYMKVDQDWVKSYVTLVDDDDSSEPGSFDGLSATVIEIETDLLNSDDQEGVLEYLNDNGLVLPTDGTYVLSVKDTVYPNKFVYPGEWAVPYQSEVSLYVGGHINNDGASASLPNYRQKGKYLTFGDIDYPMIGNSQSYGNIYAEKIVELYSSSSTVGRGVLSGMPLMEKVVMPNLINMDSSSVTGPKLKYISMESLVNAGSGAFGGNSSLEEVNFPNLQYLNGSGLSNCPKLKKLVLPALIGMNGSRFTGCPALEEVRIPSYAGNSSEFLSMSGNVNIRIFEANAISQDYSGLFEPFALVAEEIYVNSMPNLMNWYSATSFPRLRVLQANSAVIMQSATLGDSRLTEINFPSLELIRNSGRITNNKFVTSLNLPKLEAVYNTTKGLDGFSALTTLTLPLLDRLFNGGQICDNSNLVELNLPELIITDGSGGITNNPKLVTLNIPKWDQAKGMIYDNNTGDYVAGDAPSYGSTGYMNNNPMLKIFRAPGTKMFNSQIFSDNSGNGQVSSVEELYLDTALTIYGIQKDHMPQLETIFAPLATKITSSGIGSYNIVNLSFPAMKIIEQGALGGNNLLETLSLPVLETCSGAAFSNNPVLQTVNLGSLLTVIDAGISGVPSLVSVTCPNLEQVTYEINAPELTTFPLSKLKVVGGISNTKISNFNLPLLTDAGTGFAGSQNPTEFNLPSLVSIHTDAFNGISGNIITLTIPTALATEPAVVELQANNTVTLITV